MRRQILGGDNIVTLTVTFFRVMCISNGADVSPAPSIEQSVMVPRCGRGRGRDRGRDFGREHGSFKGGCGPYSSRQIVGDKGPRQCKHCERNNHISEKY